MKEDRQKEILQQIARQYAELYGRQLHEENHELVPWPADSTPVPRPWKHRYTHANRMGWSLGLGFAALVVIALFSIGRFWLQDPSQQMLPIVFNDTIPMGFSMQGYQQDLGKTIHYAKHTHADDVTITLEKAQRLPDTTGMKPVIINTMPAYGMYTADYSVLLFIKDGVLYTLTCRYDFNTLIAFGKAIV